MSSPYPSDDGAHEPSAQVRAERILLANAFLSEEWRNAILTRTCIYHWTDPRHNLIYQAMDLLATAGEHIDPVTVSERLKDGHALAEAGGPDYMLDLCSTMVSIRPETLAYCLTLIGVEN